MDAKLLILAVCVASASAAWPKWVSASMYGSGGDYASVYVNWDHATNCWKPLWYTVYYQIGDDSIQAYETTSRDTSTIIRNLEYWTDYRFELKVRCLHTHSIFTWINTGPGNPHRVNHLSAQPTSRDVVLRITEASSMPRTVDQYIVTVCRNSTSSCFTETPNRQMLYQGNRVLTYTLKQLVPSTRYSVAVQPAINYNGRRYIGGAYAISFTTDSFMYPLAYDIHESSTIVGNSTDVLVQWKLSDEVAISHFQVAIKDSQGDVIRSVDTAQPSVSFSGLPLFSKFQIVVVPVFAFRDVRVLGTARTYEFATPATTPDAVGEVSVAERRANSVVLRWTRPLNVPSAVSYAYLIFNMEEKLIETTFSEHGELTELMTYTEYTVIIQPQVSFNNATYKGVPTNFTFRTDVGRPGTVQNVTAEQYPKADTYLVTWNPPVASEWNGPIDFYLVRVFDEANAEVGNLTVSGVTNATVPVPFVRQANYRISVAAVNIDVNGEHCVGAESDISVEFNGYVAPVDFLMLNRTGTFVFVEVYSLDNTSSPYQHAKIDPYYEIELVSSGRKFSSNEPLMKITDLTPFTNESVYVRACYRPEFCSDNSTNTLQTNVAGPSAVQNLTASVVRNTVPMFSWQPPETFNGPLDHYLLTLVNVISGAEYNFTVAGNETEFVYETEDDYETYNFTVVPVNVDLDNSDIHVGEPSDVAVTTGGTRVPKPFDLRQETLYQSQIRLTWTKPDFPGYNVTWYRVKVEHLDYDRLVDTTSVTISPVKPFKSTTVLVSGCTESSTTKCGNSRQIIAKTDVGAPSAPRELTVTELQRTSAVLEWFIPLERNGPISGYSLSLQVKGGDPKSTKYFKLNGQLLKYELTELNPDAVYVASLSAFNIDSKGVKQLSPDARIEFTKSPNNNLWTALIHQL